MEFLWFADNNEVLKVQKQLLEQQVMQSHALQQMAEAQMIAARSFEKIADVVQKSFEKIIDHFLEL